MTQWTYVNADGVSLDIDDDTNYRVLRYAGVGVPDLELMMEGRPGRSGAHVRQARIRPRVLMLPIRVQGSTRALAESSVVSLLNHLAGSLGRQEPRFGRLNYSPAGGGTRSLRCLAFGGMTQDSRDRSTPVRFVLPVEIYAPHPNWYNPTEQSASGETGDPGSIIYGVSTYPLEYGPGVNSAAITVTVNGSAETESLLWECPGPVTGPELFHLDLSRGVAFPNLTVPSGLTLKVRMGWRPDGVENFRAVLEDAGGTETNVLGYMDETSRRFRLNPGANNLTAGQASEDAVTHTISWFDEYLTV